MRNKYSIRRDLDGYFLGANGWVIDIKNAIKFDSKTEAKNNAPFTECSIIVNN